jgi:glycosyltransferase involved in cell wall biosynthesis
MKPAFSKSAFSKSYCRLLMLGAAPETRGSIAAVVDAYRAHGLFARWPIDYIATHDDGGLARNAALALKAMQRLLALFAQHRRVALHVHTEAGALWRDAALIAPALAARAPVILHLHGAGYESWYDRADSAARAVIRLVLTQAACVAAPSESLSQWARGVTRKSAHVVCLPSPVAGHVPLEGSRPNLVLFLGRMEPAKGIFDLLDAISALRAAVPDVRLVCAGDGDRLAVARYAESIGIADAVKFTGWVGPSGKRALLESAAVFAMPSYDAALPISLLEAMAAGVPVVASAVGGIPEVVVDGVSGFLVAPGDRTALERQLRRLLLEPALGARIAAAARESARLRFAPERALPKLEEIYAAVGLAAESGAPARRLDLSNAA